MLELPLGPLMVDVNDLALSEQEKAFLQLPSIGAVILFSRNLQSKSQVKRLISEIKSLRTPSLLIAVDQEGGRVQRFKQAFYTLPAANQFGQLFDTNQQKAMQQSKTAGQLMATELIEVGVDFSFAPVLDCANHQSSVIGDRGFHEQPDTICKLAGAFIEGMKEAGMRATGKHFPGHGGVTGDSHHELPVDERSMQQLMERDLIPFKNLAGELGGIMTAHVQYPNVIEELPTFSRYWIEEVLRKQLRFEGIVFSDDLSMKGTHSAGTPMQRTEMALDAGCDMALICNDPQNAQLIATQLNDSYRCNQNRLNKMVVKKPPASNNVQLSELAQKLELPALVSR